MKAKSLSVFRTKLRHDAPGTVLVTIGQIIEGDDEHLRALARNRLVELVEDDAEKSAKAAKPKAEAKAKAEAKPGPAAKQQKPKAEAKAESGQGEPEQASADESAATQGAPEAGEGSE